MPEKRPPRKVTQQDRGELEKTIAGLKKREIKYPEPEDGSLILKDSACVTYPEPKGGDLLLKREGVDTHRVELKKIRPVPKVKITAPIDVVNFVKEMEDYDRERFKAIHLDTKNRVLGVENIAEGTLNSALVHPRETAKGAILNNAAGVIFVHNHPSGISKPSNEDDVLISKLRDAFKMLSIDVIDGIIIGKEGYYSYKEDMRLERMTEGGSQRIMEPKVKENGDDDACSTAMMAAMETMSKYCTEPGKLVTDIVIGGIKLEIPIPEEIIKIRADRTLTEEQRTNEIIESEWAHGEATRLCTELLGADGKRHAECIARVSRKLAEGMVRKGGS